MYPNIIIITIIIIIIIIIIIVNFTNKEKLQEINHNIMQKIHTHIHTHHHSITYTYTHTHTHPIFQLLPTHTYTLFNILLTPSSTHTHTHTRTHPYDAPPASWCAGRVQGVRGRAAGGWAALRGGQFDAASSVWPWGGPWSVWKGAAGWGRVLGCVSVC